MQTLNFSITQSLPQIVEFYTRFPINYKEHATQLDLFFTFTKDSCRALQLCPLGNSKSCGSVCRYHFPALPSVQKPFFSVINAHIATHFVNSFPISLWMVIFNHLFIKVPLRSLPEGKPTSDLSCQHEKHKWNEDHYLGFHAPAQLL